MTDEGDEEAQRVLEALDAVEAMEDPVARARAVSALFKDQRDRNPRLRAVRDQAVRDLREQKVSLRKIADRVGVSLGTVQDILRGHSGTWSSRTKKDAETAEEPAAECSPRERG